MDNCIHFCCCRTNNKQRASKSHLFTTSGSETPAGSTEFSAWDLLSTELMCWLGCTLLEGQCLLSVSFLVFWQHSVHCDDKTNVPISLLNVHWRAVSPQRWPAFLSCDLVALKMHPIRSDLSGIPLSESQVCLVMEQHLFVVPASACLVIFFSFFFSFPPSFFPFLTPYIPFQPIFPVLLQ